VSRSGYIDDDDYENWDLIRWRGAVSSAIKGRRGQAFLREMLTAFDAMTLAQQSRLIARELESRGDVCAIGAVGRARKVDMTQLDPEDRTCIAAAFNIAPALAAEIVYMNDECGPRHETCEQRFTRMRAWIIEQLRTGEKP
jgi:hypothetical protein